MSKRIMKLVIRSLRALTGLAICSLGVVFMISANIGRAPWDVFYQGISMQIGITYGQAWIYSNFIILLVLILLREPMGIGTVLDLFVCGAIADFLLWLDIVPKGTGIVSGLAIMLIGFFIFASGCYLYMSTALGVGPRDTLMVVLVKSLHIPVGVSKIIMEGSACLAGWLMGGDVGIGTVVASFGIGIAIQAVFSLLRFDVGKVKQENFADSYRSLIGKNTDRGADPKMIYRKGDVQ